MDYYYYFLNCTMTGNISSSDKNNTPLDTNVIPCSRTNLIKNGSFNCDMAEWIVTNHDGSSINVENGECVITINEQGSNIWSTSFHQHGLNLIFGEAYFVKFKARSDTVTSIQANLGEYKNDYTLYSNYETFNLSSDMTEYSFIFSMTEPTDMDSYFQIAADNHGTGTVYIDDISIKKY